mgnify:CR=1 FL=1
MQTKYDITYNVKCIGHGKNGEGCGYVGGVGGETCPQCGGMLLSEKGRKIAERLQKSENIKTIAIEELTGTVIRLFCEYADDLGCPKDKHIDEWVKEMSKEEIYDLGGKLVDMIAEPVETKSSEDTQGICCKEFVYENFCSLPKGHEGSCDNICEPPIPIGDNETELPPVLKYGLTDMGEKTTIRGNKVFDKDGNQVDWCNCGNVVMFTNFEGKCQKCGKRLPHVD